MKPIEIVGRESVPETGALVIASRLQPQDLGPLEKLVSQRPFAVLIEREAQFPSPAREHLQGSEFTTISCSRFDEDQTATIDAINRVVSAGGLVFFLPSPAVARPAAVSTIPGETLAYLVALGFPVLPLFVDHPRETRLPIESGRQQPEVVLSFGELLPPGAATIPNLLQSLFACGERSFSRRPLLEGNLAHAVVQGLRRHGSKARIIDGLAEKELGFDRLLATAIAVSKVIAKETDKPRVGIVLPPGIAAFIANVAVLIAGKIPVNLNFTAGVKAVQSAMRQADLDRFVTADPFVRQMQGFPWPPNRQLIFLERTLPHLKPAIIRWLIVSKLLPASTLCSLLRIPTKGGRKEATLMFTSGSSGEPKGVVLSHRNILANVTQFGTRIGLKPGDRLLGCLPIFHSFGATVTMWYPLIEGTSVVTYPKPHEATKLAPLIEKHRVALLASTPTFLRGFLKRVKREALASLVYVVSGAEKLPAQVRKHFEERFGQTVLEGYGLTETSPVTNVNLPDPDNPSPGAIATITALRHGSVGQLMPGLAVRVTEPETNEPLPIDQAGIIWFRGANIFEGYLNQPGKTQEVLQDGWFRTGDIGRIDHDGFLYIEGRLSRFSKIGGEMVPHETVEAHIAKVLGLDGEDERKIAVVGVPDESKGESLILLSTVASEAISQELIDLRYTLLDAGVPSLWIPKKIIRVEDIPLLASGKLDIRRCEEIARDNV